MLVREDDLEEIAENIEGNLEEDTKSSTLKEEDIPPEEEDNLNEGSGKDEEMYSWDKLVNVVHFISNESTERQVRIASTVVNKLEELVYDHRTRIRGRSRPLQKCNDNQCISIFWEIGRTKAHCLIDSGCEGIMLSPNFIRVAKSEPFLLDKPIGIQLAVRGSKCWGTYACIYAQSQSKYISVFSLVLFLYYFHFTVRTPFQFFSNFSLFFLPFYSLQKPVTLTQHC